MVLNRDFPNYRTRFWTRTSGGLRRTRHAGRDSPRFERLRFTHPTTGTTLEVEAPLPPDILAVLEELRKYRAAK
jgi:hypothetical protein